LGHYDSGHEEATLEQLHDFCRDRIHNSSLYHAAADDDNDIRVAYMHNKGSYNGGMRQHIWRRISTSAMTNQLCLEPQNDQCDGCGLSLLVFPEFIAGNFWTAKCSYVSKLLDPRRYAAGKSRIRNMVRSHYKHMDWKLHPVSLGTGRYSNEHWVVSHPSLRACDLSENVDWWYWRGDGCKPNSTFSCGDPKLVHRENIIGPRGRRRGYLTLHDRTPAEFVWGMAPRSLFNRTMKENNNSGTMASDNTTTNTNSSALDPGLGRSLFMWYQLYDEAPHSSSWIWNYSADGERWKEGVQRYGKYVVDRLLSAPPK